MLNSKDGRGGGGGGEGGGRGGGVRGMGWGREMEEGRRAGGKKKR